MKFSSKFYFLLISYSLTFPCCTDISVATESAFVRKEGKIYINKESDIYKWIDYNIDKNIRTISDAYGNNYWALKAIKNKTDPFNNSIKSLKKIVAFVGGSDLRHLLYKKIAGNQHDIVNNYMYEWEDNLILSRILPNLNKEGLSCKSLNDPSYKNVFAIINFMTVFFGIYKYFLGTNDWGTIWKGCKKYVLNDLKTYKLESGISVYKHLLSKFNNNEKEFEACVKHDWLCYVGIFNELNWKENDTNIYNGNMFCSIKALIDCKNDIFEIPEHRTSATTADNKCEVAAKEINYLNTKLTVKNFDKNFYKNVNISKSYILKYNDSMHVPDPENFYIGIYFAENFVTNYNETLRNNGLYKDSYKLNISDYDIDYTYLLCKIHLYLTKSLAIKVKEINSLLKVYLEKTILLTKELIKKKIFIHSEFKRYINPKTILKMLLDAVDCTRIQDDRAFTAVYQIFKLFSDLKITNFTLWNIRNIVYDLLDSKKSVENFCNHVKQQMDEFTSKDFSKLKDMIEKAAKTVL